VNERQSHVDGVFVGVGDTSVTGEALELAVELALGSDDFVDELLGVDVRVALGLGADDLDAELLVVDERDDVLVRVELGDAVAEREDVGVANDVGVPVWLALDVPVWLELDVRVWLALDVRL
jgi:hypothetical protein